MLDALRNKLNKVGADMISHVKVSEEIRQQRLDICRTCDQLQRAEFCKMCGCYMPAKTWIPMTKCPLGKWLPVQPGD